jgi:acyl carrier protein
MKSSPSSVLPLEVQIADIVREFLREQGKPALADSVTPKSSFQSDLGLSSLDLVELVVRVESRLEIEVPDEVAEEADTALGWAKAIREGSEAAAAKPAYRIVPPTAEPVPLPTAATDLIDVLHWHAENAHGRVHAHLLQEGGGQAVTVDQLLEEATRVARGLISLGLCRNDTVAIFLPNSLEFMQAFLGVMLSGGIAVPVYPPADSTRIAAYIERQVHILRAANIRFLISFRQARPIARLLRLKLPSLIEITDVPQLRDFGNHTSARLPHRSDVALIQFTSGTTQDPRGAILTHQGILHNIRAIGQTLDVRPGDAVVSWLPLASDLGLVGCWLFSLYHATPLTLLSPQEFLDRPEAWLWAIHDSRGTLSAAPNFAYELATRRIPMWTIDGVDLSCWRVAVNAGETVLASTVHRFAQRFARVGFRPEAITPAYGLAENSVALALSPPASPPTLRNGYFSVGKPLPGVDVRLVDHHGHPVPDGQIGRLEFRGASRCRGYVGHSPWDDDTWVDSGDLAFALHGELHITGRSKDVILRQGRQIAPEPLEEVIGALPGIVSNGVAALGHRDAASGTERLVIAAETTAHNAWERHRVEAAVRKAAADFLGFDPDSVLLLAKGALPRTANGKLRRAAAAHLLDQGLLADPPPSPTSQLTALWTENFPALAARALRQFTHLLKQGCRSLAARLLAAAVRLARLNPQLGARLVLSALGWRPTPEGTQMRGPVVIVSNRCNWRDPLSVLSLVESQAVLAGEESLLHLPPWAARLVAPLVLRAPGDMERALRDGKAVILFPDSILGTPVARCRYRLRAFEAAQATGAPILPFGMQIIRNKLFFRVGERIPSHQGSPAELRALVRRAIANIYA